MEVLLVYEAVPVSSCQEGVQTVKVLPVVINHVESLLELLDLVLVEHGEHIAGRSLGPLLSGSPPPGCFTRRHCLDCQ